MSLTQSVKQMTCLKRDNFYHKSITRNLWGGGTRVPPAPQAQKLKKSPCKIGLIHSSSSHHSISSKPGDLTLKMKWIVFRVCGLCQCHFHLTIGPCFSMRISSYGCTREGWEVWRAREKRKGPVIIYVEGGGGGKIY